VNVRDGNSYYKLERGTSTRLTSKGSSQRPIWTPDGRRLTYRATRTGTRNLFWRMADGSGTEERLTTGEGNQEAGSWSPDGQVLAFVETNPTTGADIWVL
jgi:Tol biopolymer transport system component